MFARLQLHNQITPNDDCNSSASGSISTSERDKTLKINNENCFKERVRELVNIAHWRACAHKHTVHTHKREQKSSGDLNNRIGRIHR